MADKHKGGHTGRYREIAGVLTRHGLGWLVGMLGIERFLPFHRGLLGHPRREAPYTRPEDLRMALEELGPTFIKLGQILSTRADLLPPEYQSEFAKLQDSAPAVPGEVVKNLLEGELGRPPEEVFAIFDPTPLASASIGQAHAATLHDGTEVVVKVRRPKTVGQVGEDLEILQNLAARAAHRWDLAEQYDLVGLTQEFAQTLQSELDYIREGRSAEHFATNFADDPGVHVPRVHWDTTTSRVLTLERIRGIKIDDLAGLEAAGIDRKSLAERASRIVLKMVFEDGFFHADPHPGNFFIEPNGGIGLIDFGMVGTVDERTQEQLLRLLLAITRRDADRLVDALLDLGVVRRRVERQSLRRDLEHLLSRYYGRPLGELALGPMIEDALAVVRRHHLHLPPTLALLLKTIVMNEGLGVRLDPDFKVTTVLPDYARRMMLRQYSPGLWARRLGQAGLDAALLGVELPQQLHRIMGDLERGSLEVGMRPTGFESIIRRFERLANRLVLGIIAAALINGLAILMSVYHPPGWQEGAGTLFGVGFLFALLLGAFLLWSTFRPGGE